MKNGLILSNVSKRFGEFWALREIRATVPTGKVTAFIGPNGAGKTTLLHVISGALQPNGGDIVFDGRSIVGLLPHEIARLGIGRQFQDGRVFKGLTVLENVMVAAFPTSAQVSWRAWFRRKEQRESTEKAEAEALRWIEHVGLIDRLNETARDLSFGQQKLLSLARLFAQQSRLLLLDEPTAGLSPQMIDQVVTLIRRSVEERGLTVVIVEHNMSVVADLTSWIHFLHEGRVAFSGETTHVLGNRSVREIYMGL